MPFPGKEEEKEKLSQLRLSAPAVAVLQANLSNLYLLSLALTDLLHSILVMPAAAVYSVLGRWTFGQNSCTVKAFSQTDIFIVSLVKTGEV